MSKLPTISILILLSCLVLNTAYGTDWTSWRGPTADGISLERDWDANALAGNPNILWEANIGKGHSTIAVKGDYLYTMGNKMVVAGSDTLYEDIVFCFNSKTGKVIWRYSYPCNDTNYPGPRTTPVVDGNSVYTLSWTGDLISFDTKSGRVNWRRNIEADSLAPKPGWGFAGSPVIEGDQLIITAGKSGIVFNKNTGKVIWKSEPKTCNLSSPILFTFNGKRYAILADERNIYAVDVNSGDIKWTYRWRSYTDPIVLPDNRLFLCGGRRGSALLRLNDIEPEVLWDNRNMGGGFQTCVILGDYAYGFGYMRRTQPFQCVDITTGELKWTKDLGEYGALMAADGKLVIITGYGTLMIAEASSTGFKEISSAEVIKMPPNNLNVERPQRCYCWSAPVLANGIVYARDNHGHLVGVDMNN